MENAVPVLEALKKRLEGTRRLAVVGVGDDLSLADRLGMTAAREIDRQKIPGVQVFLAMTVPENITGALRRYGPDHVLFLDAAEMGERPGTLAIIAPGQVRACFFSTHALPLPVVMEYIEREIGAPVTLLGIQPDKDGKNDMDGDTLPPIDKKLRLLSAFLKKELS